MDHPLLNLNELIKKEADEILSQKGLLAILNAYGNAHVSGSYFLNLMTWRDLDIYLETENITETDFFLLGGRIASTFNPVKMSYRNERKAKTPGLPNGLYWGTYLGNERAGDWKIDIWAVDKSECQQLLDHCEAIRKKLTPEASLYILNIKSQCWKDPAYRRSYTSGDIYKAVLEKNITTIEGFKDWIRR